MAVVFYRIDGNFADVGGLILLVVDYLLGKGVTNGEFGSYCLP